MRVNILAGALFVMSTYTQAHSIFVDCEHQGSDVRCLASFSDGSSADNLPYEVLSYDEDPLISGRTDEKSVFKFVTPAEEYFILLDAGPGHVVEVDMQDVVGE